MKFKVIIISLLISAGYLYWKHNVTTEPYIDPALQIFTNEWKTELDNAGISYEAGFNRIDNIILTSDSEVSAHFDIASRTIMISIAQMERGEFSTRAAIWHELGHYVFRLEHSDGIMNSYSLSEDSYINDWARLKNEYLIKCIKNEWNGKI